MNKFAISFGAVLVCLLTGCATVTPDEPLPEAPAEVASIAVGRLLHDMDSGKSRFNALFNVTEAATVEKLAGILTETEYTTPQYPWGGILSWQQYLDEDGNVLAYSKIVNYNNTIVIQDPKDTGDLSKSVLRSPNFCREIYDLMMKHCPDEIREQQEAYQSVNRSLELLLFEGNQGKQPAAE